MRYRTAAILTAVLAIVNVGMFSLPATVLAGFLPSLEQRVDPPAYERILLGAAAFCIVWKWIVALLTPPIVVALFIIAALTGGARVHKPKTGAPAPTTPPPTLWNPTAAACWSLLFSPAFGAFLHARNADAMGRIDEAKANRAWFYVSAAYLGLKVVTMFIPLIPEGVFHLVGVGLLLGWFFSLGAGQIAYVKDQADARRILFSSRHHCYRNVRAATVFAMRVDLAFD